MKQMMTLLLALFMVSITWSQESEEADEAEVTEVTEASDAAEDEYDPELDEQGYGTEEDEDDFIPSQEVSADQSLPFPVDI